MPTYLYTHRAFQIFITSNVILATYDCPVVEQILLTEAHLCAPELYMCMYVYNGCIQYFDLWQIFIINYIEYYER